MYAIVEIAGQQFKVEPGKKIFVHRLDAAEGDTVKFDKVLLIDNDGDVKVGSPVVEDNVIEGKVLAHVRGDKVIIFKKKRRKGYQKRTGHRQDFSQVEILSVGGTSAPKKKATKKAEVPVEEAEAPVVAKKAPAKKTAAKKSTKENAE